MARFTGIREASFLDRSDKSDARRAAGPHRGASSRVLRIIAGKWRGRRFRFTAEADIRPTPDRVRETLFNWLQAHVPQARCLDLCAGSGALGLEALSRGAARVHFVESDATAVRELRERLLEWGAQGGTVERADTLRYLRGKPEPFDIVFLDPPFAAGLLGTAAHLLDDREWLAPAALIYVESAARAELPALPASWRLLKAKRAGEVGYHLFEKGMPGEATE
jgi:16S rRNA (guanine966-N2)-methyltransferase